MKSVSHFTRSTNVAYDFSDPSSTRGIILTNPIQKLINSIHLASKEKNASKAISIIGPYGTGKSTGLLYALKYFSGELPLNQQNELAEFHTDLNSLGDLEKDKLKPHITYHPCILVGKRQTINSALSDELIKLSKILKLRFKSKSLPFAEIVKEKILPKLKKDGKGLIIVVDELGKFLENAVDNPSDGDVYVLQELAEIATRSNGHLIIITSRHQSFESYASSLSNAEINEWKKIQGRYHDIVFQSNQKESLIFISEALKAQSINNLKIPSFYKKYIKVNNERLFRNISDDILKDTSILHPIVMVLITPLFKKLAQNERSVFSFINSPENHSLNNFLEQNENDNYKLYNLFDYLFSNLSFAIISTSLASTWSQIESSLIKHNDLTELEEKLFKTIAIFDLFRDVLHLDSNIENLNFAISKSDSKVALDEIQKTITTLFKKKVITKNETWKSYHVKYGGTVDVEALINEKLIDNFNLDEITRELNRTLPLPPILAKEHYARTGTIRYFLQKYVSEDFHLGEESKLVNVVEPTIFHVFYKNSNRVKEIVDSLEYNKDNKTLPAGTILYFIKISNRLEKIFSYFRAANRVKIEDNSVSNDEVAFQHLSKILIKSENDIENEIRKLYNGVDGFDLWTDIEGMDKIVSAHSINPLLSKSFDIKYPNTPEIFNELANKTNPSPSANVGINKLLIAMLNHDKENLGIIGGSEIGMYFSILKKSGIHNTKNNRFQFMSPNDANLHALWDDFDAVALNRKDKKFTLLDLYEIMNDEPYGIKAGLHCIIGLAYLLSHDGEFSWYEEDKFIIDINPSVIELLKKRPQDFSFRFISSSPFNNEFYDKIKSEFKIKGLDKEKVTPIDILSPILNEISSLPEYTNNTALELSITARNMRKAIKEAIEPESLLFESLPDAFDLPRFDEMNSNERDRFINLFKANYLELKQAFPNLLGKIREAIFSRFNLTDSETSILELRKRVERLKDLEDKKLKPFIVRILLKSNNDDKWAESIASAVLPNPPRFWKDRDFHQFEVELDILVHRFELLEKIRTAKMIDKKTLPQIRKIKEKIISDMDFQNLSIKEKEYLLNQLIDEMILKKND